MLDEELTPTRTATPVALTGLGMICPLGTSFSECWESMLQGRSGVRRITKFDTTGCATTIGGQLPDMISDIEKKRTPKRLLKQTIQPTRLIRICTYDALEDSGIDRAAVDTARCAVVIGSSGSSVGSPGDLTDAETERFRIIRDMVNAPAAWISIELGFKGPAFTVSASSASGIYAASTAFDLIRYGLADVAIAGAVDTPLTRNSLLRGNFLKLLSTCNGEPEKALRPFDARRDGCVLSDGACAVVLESLSHARNRNADVYAWLQGYGTTSECHGGYTPAPDGGGIAKAMELGLQNAGIRGEHVGYISSSATSAVIGDAIESQAIGKIFADHAGSLSISAIQSMVGHTMGASGLIALAAAAMGLKTQKAPPTINQEYPDAACNLDYIPNVMRELNGVEGALVNAFGLGGHNGVFALSRHERIPK